MTENICFALNCPFKDNGKGNGGCTRFSVSAMCYLSNVFDFRDPFGKNGGIIRTGFGAIMLQEMN